jgi:hypothetical protein
MAVSLPTLLDSDINRSEPWELLGKHSYTFMHRLFESVLSNFN